MIKAPARCPGRRALLLRVHLSPMVKFKHNWAMIATAGQTIFLPRGNMEKRKLATPCLLFVGRLMVGKVSHPCLKPYKEMVDATAEKIESISRCFSIIQLNQKFDSDQLSGPEFMSYLSCIYCRPGSYRMITAMSICWVHNKK